MGRAASKLSWAGAASASIARLDAVFPAVLDSRPLGVACSAARGASSGKAATGNRSRRERHILRDGTSVRTLGIIEVRPDSSPHAMRSRRWGAPAILSLAARRVTDCQLLDGVAVWAPEGAAPWIESAVPSSLPVVEATECDPLAGFAAALDVLGADAAVVVCWDRFLIDPHAIDRLVAVAAETPDCDVASYALRHADGGPAPTDVFGQWCRTDAVRRADRLARQPHARSQATAALWSRPEVFRARLLPLPKELEGEGVELALDWQSNWEHTEALLDAYAESDLDWRRIAPLLRRTQRAAA